MRQKYFIQKQFIFYLHFRKILGNSSKWIVTSHVILTCATHSKSRSTAPIRASTLESRVSGILNGIFMGKNPNQFDIWEGLSGLWWGLLEPPSILALEPNSVKKSWSPERWHQFLLIWPFLKKIFSISPQKIENLLKTC